MGFDPEMAREALKKHAGSIQRAIDDLIRNGGVITFSSNTESSSGGSSESGSSSGE